MLYLVKPNQIGTLTETIDVIKLAHKNKLQNNHIPQVWRL